MNSNPGADELEQQPSLTLLGNWWSSPCGLRDVLAISLPMIISTGAWSIQLFVDRMFLFGYSETAMAATMPAGTWFWTLVCFPVGVCGYLNTFVAQYFGAKQFRRIGEVTWQALWIGILASPLYLLLIPVVPLLFAFSGHSEELARDEARYLQILLFAAGGAVLSAAQSAFFSGRGQTRIVMYSDIGATLINVVFDYMWIFGKCGFPEMGIEGAGWATVLSQWFKVIYFGWLMWHPSLAVEFGFRTAWRINRDLLRRLVFYGGPSGVEFLVEAGAFAILTLLMGGIGERELAATTLAINVNMVAFIPMIGVSISCSVLVGQQLTGGRPDLAAKATWSSLCIALVYSAFFGLFYLGTPDLFLVGHSAIAQGTSFTDIRDLTVVLLRFVAAYCLFDAANLVLAGAIKGAGDTWFVLIVTIVVSIVSVAACWFGQSLGVLWWWFVLTAWLWARGVIFFFRFIGGKWKSMRVIEGAAVT